LSSEANITAGGGSPDFRLKFNENIYPYEENKDRSRSGLQEESLLIVDNENQHSPSPRR
jgi:hypothetical protein